MLPYTAVYRRDFAPEAMREAAAAMRTDDAPQALYDLMQLAATRKSLRQMEVTTNELDALCDRLADPETLNRRAAQIASRCFWPPMKAADRETVRHKERLSRGRSPQWTRRSRLQFLAYRQHQPRLGRWLTR